RWEDDDRDDWRPRWRPREEEQRQSGWGVASFVTAMVSGLGAVALIALGILMTIGNGGDLDENTPEAIFLGLSLVACLFGGRVGGVLGLIGVLQPDRKKVLAVLGLSFNALTVAAVIGLVVVGVAMG